MLRFGPIGLLGLDIVSESSVFLYVQFLVLPYALFSSWVFMLFNADMFPPLFSTFKIKHYVIMFRGIGFLVLVRPLALLLVICTCDYDSDCDF